MKLKLLKTVLWLNLVGCVGLATALAAEGATVPNTAKPVYEHYLKIQTALADDSLKGVSENAAAMAKAVRQSADQNWPDQLAAQSDVLAKATSLDSAREAFKSVSKSLIEHWVSHPVLANQYQRAYCPMAKAAWLQTGSEIHNPYLGKAMSSCGTFLPKAQTQSSSSAVCPANRVMNDFGERTMNRSRAQAGCSAS